MTRALMLQVKSVIWNLYTSIPYFYIMSFYCVDYMRFGTACSPSVLP